MNKFIERVTSIAKASVNKHGRSMLGWGRDAITGREMVRIAILGSKKAGKSVMLTAIQNYLKYLASKDDYDESSLESKMLSDDGWRVVSVVNRLPKVWEDFNYGYNREKLCHVTDADEGWPDETEKARCMQMDIDLKQHDGKDAKNRFLTVQILDIPGERFSDLGTMYGRDYQTWCDLLCENHHDKSTCARPWKEYEDRVKKILEEIGDNKDVESFIKQCRDAYEDFVMLQAKSFSPFVTPSGFLLPNTLGKTNAAEPMDEPFPCPLIPLTDAVFKSKRQLARKAITKMRKEYNRYKQEYELGKLAKWLGSAHQLYYLVDVLGILMNGKGAFEGARAQCEMVLQNFMHGNPSVFGRSWRFLFKTRLRMAYGVATQIDRVLSADHANIEGLLKILMKRQLGDLGCIHDILSCAAVKSTREADGKLAGNFKKNRLRKKTEGDNYGADPDYRPMPVPAKWDFSESCDYHWKFPEPLEFPEYESVNPPNTNLKEIVKKMILP